jgi:hypothetical protein
MGCVSALLIFLLGCSCDENVFVMVGYGWIVFSHALCVLGDFLASGDVSV